VGSKLWRFHGGIHLAGEKGLSGGQPIRQLPQPELLVLPLNQHIGDSALPIVRPGDRVRRGQMVASARGYISSPLHSPCSGTVRAIEPHPFPHPSGLDCEAIVIENDGHNDTVEQQSLPHWSSIEPATLHEVVRNAGLIGLGGAGFPTFIKLGQGLPVETLILNGAECEPYITCDDRLMRERAFEVVEGARIMLHMLQAGRCLIGIEDNKPDAHQAMVEAVAVSGEGNRIEVVAIPTLYPTGGEKQLIRVLTGREVPSQSLPLAVGVVCQNVATAAAVYHAIVLGQPLIERIVTVTGRGVAAPGNWLVPIGTPMSELVAASGGYRSSDCQLVMGGPMMGLPLAHDRYPIIKTSNCLLVGAPGELNEPDREPLACIRCGRCAEVCPARLLPQQLYWYARARDFDQIQDYSLFDCIECGCCSHVCPSRIPLVHYYRFAKTAIWGQERDRRKADLARLRHEARSARMAREKAEKEARLAKRRVAASAGGDSNKDADAERKAKIQAALERAKAKKAAAGIVPRNTDQLTDAQQQQIDEANERRARASDDEPSINDRPPSKE
jgi:electron transport complex protein RnfC